jgi:hypothetical protein
MVNSTFGYEVVDKSLKKDLVWDSISSSEILNYNTKYPLIEPDYTYNSINVKVVKFGNLYFSIENNIQDSHGKVRKNKDLFCFLQNPPKIIKVTNIGMHVISDVFLFEKNLFFVYFKDLENKVSLTGIFLISPNNPYKPKMYEMEGHDCLTYDRIYPVGDNLVIHVVAKKRYFNYLYLFTFWLPRGRPEKWKSEDICEYDYTFDKDLNLISKTLVKTYKK